VLQEVWSRVYAAVIASPHNTNAKRSDAEEQAWEAVRRANGGEMPQERVESVICGPREPTNEEMVEVLAPIVARERYEHFAKASARVQEEMIARTKCALMAQPADEEDPLATALGLLAVASWKAARAWGRK
jgi:hypothetical protein